MAFKKCWEIRHVTWAHDALHITVGTIASHITSLTIVYSTVYAGADQRTHQSSASLALVRGIHRGPVNSPHKWPATRKIWWRHHEFTHNAMQARIPSNYIWIRKSYTQQHQPIDLIHKYPECTCSISHNVPFRTEMCTLLFWMEHCGIWNRCILGFAK